MSRSKLERIIHLYPSQDEQGKYFNYCNYWYHTGIIPHKKAKKCRSRKCKYYQKYRIEDGDLGRSNQIDQKQTSRSNNREYI